MIDVFYTMYSNLYHFTHFRMVLKLIFDMLALFCRIKAAKDNKSNSLKADFFAFRLLLSAGILMNSYFLKYRKTQTKIRAKLSRKDYCCLEKE